MLDMIYGYHRSEIPCSDMGKAVFGYTAGSGRSPQAVRHRRSAIASIVDEISARRGNARILAIASGHLREVELSEAFIAGAVQEWVAVDQDEASLLECNRSYGGAVVRPIKGSVRQILTKKLSLGKFDLIYAAGLLDYLTDSVAEALLSRMFEMLKPNGKIMIANFASGFIDAGYMEAFMDWRLIYRSQQEVRTIVESLGDRGAADIQVFNDPWNAIVYATVNKESGVG